jgi:prostaglandin-endoperoxide synthase 2
VAKDPTTRRDTSRDGLRNRSETFVLTHLQPFWSLVNRTPRLAHFFNNAVVNMAVLKAPTRPLALSTLMPYTSWQSLTDRTWFARYLPPQSPPDLPTVETVSELFRIGPEGQTLSTRSTLLFPAFAQWFTDGFLLTNVCDPARTTSTHEIDLNPLYGITPDVTRALRRLSEVPGQRGRLKSEIAQGEEWAPRLYDDTGNIPQEFAILPLPLRLPPGWEVGKRATLFAFGGERANTTAYTAMINTLFLREHNRLCEVLEAAHPDWDDERLFQTVRNINIVQLIRIVVEEYINHISPYWLRLLSTPTPCYRAVWNRPNWIPIEFNLLYRWHSLVPDLVEWDGQNLPMDSMVFNHGSLLRDGLGRGFDSASRTRASQLGLFNTADFLLQVEADSIKQGRSNKLALYNDYREAMHYPRVTRFEQISGDSRVVEGLRRVYGDVTKVEFFVGLFAEEIPPRSAVPQLIGRMVAADAFSHALTNPLLSPLVFNAATFSAEGMKSIQTTSTLKDLVERNIVQRPASCKVTMELDGQEAKDD